MPIYGKDNPEDAAAALETVAQQTRLPDELVIVEDGPLPEALRSVIEMQSARLPMQRVVLERNCGLGIALARGLEACRFEFVARMDADDLARADRFERQLALLQARPNVVLVGSAVEEFRQVPGDLGRLRRPPTSDAQLRRRARTRNPFNHMSVMFRRQAIMDAGNYQHRSGFEDYDLWLRVLMGPGKVANLDQVLVDVRVGNGMIERRHGWSYLRREIEFLASCRARGLLSVADVALSALVRAPSRLLPTRALGWLYDTALRER